ncbi:MAG: hypothetical protein ACT4P1_10810 [Sporichthyaceae bacterium]
MRTHARTAVTAAAVTLLAAAVVLLALRRDDADSDDPFANTLIADLCALRASTTALDVDAARIQFFDRAHEPLHRLAQQLSEDHRSQAARLLEAKQVVESQLSQGRGPDPVEDLDPLITETAQGFTLLGADVAPSCLTEEVTR